MKRKRRKKPSKSKRQLDKLSKLKPNAAGIDIGSEVHYVAVPEDRDETPVRNFRSFTGDLYRLADWLKECRVDTVAMESTGIYWIPLYEILEERGFEVMLVNARHVKNVPGRKTDVLDCQWLQQLHCYGLLRGSFRPSDHITALRSYVRHRENLVKGAATHVQHIQKALGLMNLQLHNVLSDVTGQTGMRIVRAIVAGTRDPKELAKHRDRRCRASTESIVKSLTGHYRDEHVFAMKQAVELYDYVQQKIAECDAAIENELRKLAGDGPDSGKEMPTARKSRRSKNEPSIDIRSLLYRRTGADLSQIDGIGSYNALRIFSEIGDDMTCWPTEKHFTSWLTLAPRNKITGGKIKSSRTQRSANRVAIILRLAATAVGKTNTALGAFYRRLGARVGKAIACTATARKLAERIYRMLRYGHQYQDPGADYYEARYRQRVLRNLSNRAKKLGFVLVEHETPSATEAVVSP